MKRITVFLLLLTILSVTLLAQASLKDIIITPTEPSSLTIQVWTNRALGATYYQGESIHIYFKTSQDAYVTLYDYTPEGSVRILFPNFFQQDNFVRGGEVYVIPNPSYNYNLVVSGQNGREVIEAVASTLPNVLPSTPKIKKQPFIEMPNALDFMKSLKIKIVGKPIAVATTYFYVGYVPRTGVVHFTSNPSGATLFVDGINEGKTPTDLRLAEGNHLAVFWQGMYHISKDFTVKAGAYQVISAVIPITPPTVSFNVKVNVSTSPYAALVFVNGKMLGISPCTIDLTPGVYEFTIVKPGYHTVVKTMTIKNPVTNFNLSLSRIGNYTYW